jgi:hypothetical protein
MEGSPDIRTQSFEQIRSQFQYYDPDNFNKREMHSKELLKEIGVDIKKFQDKFDKVAMPKLNELGSGQEVKNKQKLDFEN